jgi:hypothetical protein
MKPSSNGVANRESDPQVAAGIAATVWQTVSGPNRRVRLTDRGATTFMPSFQVYEGQGESDGLSLSATLHRPSQSIPHPTPRAPRSPQW